MYSLTTATRKIARLKKRIRAVPGGTSASKTISILLILIDLSQTDKTPKLTSVVSESLPHLKRGAERDFRNIMQAHNYWHEKQWNATDHIYTFETGSQMEFFGADSPDKLRGPRRDRLYINEANNVPHLAFDQLEVRTRELIFLDWNPTNEFWWYTEVAPYLDHDLVKVTYVDNEALDKQTVASIEARKHNVNWWKVYGLGELGELEGQIYKGWTQIDRVPDEARLERYGLDFGYTNDPTAIVAIYRWNNAYVLDEIVYQTGMVNQDIARKLKGQLDALVVGDSAEPKSIDEIKFAGVNIMPSTKGPGSVNQGIQTVQDQEIFVTKRSTNIIKEQRNYLWKTDRDGKTLNVPEDQFNHAMDALRYAITDLKHGAEPNIRWLS